MAKKKTRRDVAEIARSNLEQIIGEKLNGEPLDEPEPAKPDARDPAAVSLGRRGGLKGGRARAEKLSKERKAEIARKAVQARWKGKKGKDQL